MNAQPLDIRDYRPYWQDRYLNIAGWHFTKEACEFAIGYLRKKGDKGELIPIATMSKQEVDELLKKHNVNIENKNGYDYVYVANMAIADVVGSSVPDEKHHALYVKNIVDDPDAGDGEIMRKWYAAMVARGIYVDWERMIGNGEAQRAY